MLGLATLVATLLRFRARACVALACLAAMLFTASTVSANPPAETKTRVWDFSSAAPLNVWLERSASPRTHLENQSGSLELTSVSPHAAGGGGGAARSFFEGTRYTPKVLQQMRGGPGEFHSFPESVTAFESAGTVRTITGGDGVARQMLEIPGSYATSRGTVLDGVFQFIKEADGAINHRLFVPRTP